MDTTYRNVCRANRAEQLTVAVYVRSSIASARPSPDLVTLQSCPVSNHIRKTAITRHYAGYRGPSHSLNHYFQHTYIHTCAHHYAIKTIRNSIITYIFWPTSSYSGCSMHQSIRGKCCACSKKGSQAKFHLCLIIPHLVLNH